MTTNAVSLGKSAVRFASYGGYIGERYKDATFSNGDDPVLAYLWFNAMMPSGNASSSGGDGCSGGGCAGCDGWGLIIGGIVCTLLSGGVLTTVCSMAANDTRRLGNDFNAKKKEAQSLAGQANNNANEQAIATNAATIFNIMSTENRLSSLAFGLFATGFAILTVTAVGALLNWGKNNCDFDVNINQSYLNYGAYAGALSFGIGGLAYIGSSIYKLAKRNALEEAADKIKSHITNAGSEQF